MTINPKPYQPSDEYARIKDIQASVCPVVTIGIEGKRHRWKMNQCLECGVTPDRAGFWCSNASLRRLFGAPKQGLIASTKVVNIERLEKLIRRDLITEARYLNQPTTSEVSDQELRRSIYIARATGKVPKPVRP